jgi:hypothetical protein
VRCAPTVRCTRTGGVNVAGSIQTVEEQASVLRTPVTVVIARRDT